MSSRKDYVQVSDQSYYRGILIHCTVIIYTLQDDFFLKQVFNAMLAALPARPSGREVYGGFELDKNIFSLICDIEQKILVHAPKLWAEEISKRASLFP